MKNKNSFGNIIGGIFGGMIISGIITSIFIIFNHGNVEDYHYFIFVVVTIISYYYFQREDQKQYNYRLLNSQYPDNWNEIKARVRERDGHKCGNCGRTINLDVHHIVPLSRGGSNEFSNLRTLCHDCHKKIHPHLD